MEGSTEARVNGLLRARPNQIVGCDENCDRKKAAHMLVCGQSGPKPITGGTADRCVFIRPEQNFYSVRDFYLPFFRT